MWQYAVLFNLLAGQEAENDISLTAGSSHICCCGEKKISGILVFLGSKKLTYVGLVCVTWGACPLWLAALRGREVLFWDTSHKENLVWLEAHHSMEQTRIPRQGWLQNAFLAWKGFLQKPLTHARVLEHQMSSATPPQGKGILRHCSSLQAAWGRGGQSWSWNHSLSSNGFDILLVQFITVCGDGDCTWCCLVMQV